MNINLNKTYFLLERNDKMDCVIPYTKELTFDSKIAEITTISLEHEMKVDNDELNGNFIITGEYKAHELSVNKEKFKYELPFFIELGENIDKETIDFNIEDFNYNIVDENILKVNIEFSVKAQELAVEPREEIFTDVPDAKVIETEIDIRKDDETTKIEDELNNDGNDSPTEEVIMKEEENEIEKDESNSLERLDNITKSTIIENIANTEEEYITYQIHIVKENETIESICSLYNTNTNVLGDYNDLKELKVGDKLIIPQDIDE